MKEKFGDNHLAMIACGGLTNIAPFFIGTGIGVAAEIFFDINKYGDIGLLEKITTGIAYVGIFNILNAIEKKPEFSESLKDLYYYAPGNLCGIYLGMTLADKYIPTTFI